MTEVWDVAPPPTQLDRIEGKLDQLLAKKKPKPRASKQVEYPQEFEDVWAAYPRRVGSNPKKKALGAWFARGDAATFCDGDPDEYEMAERFAMEMGVIAYCQFCDATVEDKRFVMQASTFLGPEQHYRCDWTIPTAPDNVPRENSELVSWANEKGYRGAYPNESFADYRKALEVLHRQGE